MTLAQLRDLAIVLFAILGIFTLAVFLVLSLIIFDRLRRILELGQSTMGNLQGTTSFVSELVVKPIIKGVSFVSGVRRGIGVIAGFSRRKGRKSHG
ncbi:MAG: hypothetical protein HYU86_04290 [Chloroflexi bacterium]|nr:hypothetical protein [Chloroflexota bacterium]